MSVKEFVEKVRNKEVDIVEHTHKVIDETKKINDEYNFFNVISDELALKQAKSLSNSLEHDNVKGKRLLGVMISVKDNICVKGVESSAGSKILKGYKPLFDAHVIKRVVEEGGIIIGKTGQDEFGFGSFSTNVGIGFEIPKNPIDKERVCGGSSGGAGGITKKASFDHIALGESTGGSIAAPASFCGVFGLCPTYGRVSRNGLIDYANSLDKIGPLGQNMNDVALLQEVIGGYDANDSTSLNIPEEELVNFAEKSSKNFKIGVIKESFGKGNDAEVERQVKNTISKLKNNGIECSEISLKLPIKYGLAAYYMIATSEASTNLAKYCGMRYGAFDKLKGGFNEYFTDVRSKNLGEEAKRRIILGTFARMSGYRDAYYIKAMQVRTLIINEYKNAFKKFDLLLSPTTPALPPKIKDVDKLSPLQNYMMDVMLVGPNLAGLPHLNVPIGLDKLPVGMLLIGDHLQEKKLINAGSLVGKLK